MWLLITPDEKHIYLKPNISLSIGRKKGDIILPHDASISRLHASIVIKPHTDFLEGKPTSLCILKDEGSKYGTYISRNEKFEKITNDVNVNNQDIIRIGLQKEVFIATYKPIITMISALQDNEKDKLLKIMGVIDGVIISDWNKYCTHLTVVKPKLTQKVAVSLAAGIPIVSIDYWDAVKSSIERGDPLPKTDDFIPEISEQYISKEVVSLSPNYKRKALFTNLTFNFFSSNQYEMYKAMVTLAGGKAVLYNLNNKEDNTLKCNSIFIQCFSTDSTQFTENSKKDYDYICKKLNASKHRIIPESEISLAILHCSIEQYCNPKYNFGKFLQRKDKPSYNIPETLVIDTQDQNIVLMTDFTNKQTSSHNKNYIQETLECDGNESIQENEMSQESSDSPKQLAPQVESTTSKTMLIPETIESFHDSQRNAENNESVAKSHRRDLCSFKRKICIPETVDDNYSNSFENSNKKGQTSNTVAMLNISSEEDDCNVSVRKQPRTSKKDTLVSIQNLSKTKTTNNVQSDEIQIEREATKNWTTINSSRVGLFKETDNEEENCTLHIRIRCNPPGKTFQKARVKIPEKRLRIMDVTEEY